MTGQEAHAPARVVGVVSAAHGVEVELLEQEHVADHALLGDRLAAPLVVLVPVDALQQDGPPVHAQLPARHLHPPQAHLRICSGLVSLQHPDLGPLPQRPLVGLSTFSILTKAHLP